MQNTKILEMVNNGQIEELKALIQDEIFMDGLKNKPGAKQRYAAMKRYFRYQNNNSNIACKMPCKEIEVHRETYNSFVDGYSLVLTTESIGEMESFDNSQNSYLKVEQMINFSVANSVEKINFNAILAEAKAKGYKYKKSEIGNDQSFQYVFKYKEGYFKIGILDQAFSIINDGKEAEIYYVNEKALLFIKTSIGIAGILPVRPIDDIEKCKTIIKINDSKVA